MKQKCPYCGVKSKIHLSFCPFTKSHDESLVRIIMIQELFALGFNEAVIYLGSKPENDNSLYLLGWNEGTKHGKLLSNDQHREFRRQIWEQKSSESVSD